MREGPMPQCKGSMWDDLCNGLHILSVRCGDPQEMNFLTDISVDIVCGVYVCI